jgi:hypothetical protein
VIRELPKLTRQPLVCTSIIARWFAAVILLLAGGELLASDRWPDERIAGPFICHADFSLNEHLNLINEMAQLQRDLVHTLGVGQSREAIHIFLFAQQSTYQSYMKTYFPKVPYRRALFVKGRGPGMVFAHQNHEFEVDVRHESTHALLHASLPMVPLWLDEGLAEYFEVPRDERAYDNPHLTPLQWSLRLGIYPKIESLEQISELEHMSRSEYRGAWAWVHFMLHSTPETYDELVRFLADLQAHTPPGKLSDRLRRRLPDLERRFVEHFRTWKR